MFSVFAQDKPIVNSYSTVLQGIESDTISINMMLGLEYLSLQFVPALYGDGDSVDFSYIPEVCNSYAGVNYTDYAAAKTVSSTLGDSDAIMNFSPFQSILLRLIVTGISTDTVTVNLYSVQK